MIMVGMLSFLNKKNTGKHKRSLSKSNKKLEYDFRKTGFRLDSTWESVAEIDE